MEGQQTAVDDPPYQKSDQKDQGLRKDECPKTQLTVLLFLQDEELAVPRGFQ
jgi:hypothetical protein